MTDYEPTKLPPWLDTICAVVGSVIALVVFYQIIHVFSCVKW